MKPGVETDAATNHNLKDIMDAIGQILDIASKIYTLVEKVKANKKRCCRVRDRVKGLERLVMSISDRKQTSEDVKKALEWLSTTLDTAWKLIGKYTTDSWIKLVLKSGKYGDDFDDVNNRLTDHFQILSGFLKVDDGDMLFQMFERSVREQEDEVDRREDDNQLQTLLMEFQKEQQEKLDAMQKEVQSITENVLQVLLLLKKPSITDEAIRMIKEDELVYNEPKEPFMTTPISEVYKGMYRGFPVAIKRYIDVVTSASVIRKIFDQEVEDMKQFESPNILRMFGICVRDEKGPCPQFLIIMEYCEHGSLREVLNSGRSLSWPMKVRMCRDAARGLYRLHQSENKTKVHGCITSSKFLVGEGDTVKLAGFELTKTETSMRKTTREVSAGSLCYCSPQLLSSLNNLYNKKCEIYSFGIVMWEVATGLEPFKDWGDKDIMDKVGKEKFKQELPDDCPDGLKSLINSCRDFDEFKRPSAGVLVDKLQSLLIQLSAETLPAPAST